MVCNLIRQRNSQTDEDLKMTRTISNVFKRLAVFAVLLLTAGIVHAQRGNFSPEQMRARFEEQNKELAQKLALTEDQMPKFMEIMTASVDKRIDMIAEMRGRRGDRQGFREKMASLDEETIKNLAEVLTEDQMKKYEEIQANRPRRRRG